MYVCVCVLCGLAACSSSVIHTRQEAKYLEEKEASLLRIRQERKALEEREQKSFLAWNRALLNNSASFCASFVRERAEA